MERYDYYEAVTADIIEAIKDDYNISDFESRDEMWEKLNDDLWINDSVTGNASGSYFCNSWKAEEALIHNLDLLAEACREFGSGCDILKDGAESCDVTIRCFLLGQCIDSALDELGITDESFETEESEAI